MNEESIEMYKEMIDCGHFTDSYQLILNKLLINEIVKLKGKTKIKCKYCGKEVNK